VADIRHRVAIKASPERVYEAVATREGVAGWWTRTVEGENGLGGKLQFFFGGPEPAATMEIVDLAQNERVRWHCVQGPDEWLDTEVQFDLKPGRDDHTVVLFTHSDWREPVEFMHHCSSRWAYFLFSLKAGLERGEATPYPEDTPIDDWG